MEKIEDSRDDRHRRYFRTVVATFVVLLVVATTFSALVDPYGIFGSPGVSHLTSVKSAAAARLRLSKAYRVALAHPATLVTGSSVTNLGLDPASPAWRPEHRPVFNLGIDGASLDEQRRYLLNALAVSKPRLVVLCTSFDDLIPMPSATGSEPTYFQPQLRTLDDGRPNPAFPLAHIKDLASATLSFRALSDSALTLVRQSGAWINYQTDAGFEMNAPEEMYAATQGARAAAAKMNEEMAVKMLAWADHPTWSIEPLAVMIRAARAAGADVIVMIAPVHADIVEVRRQIGVADQVAAWRAATAQLVASEGASPGGADHVQLWDFSGLSTYTTTAVTLRAMSDPARWFWDTEHFSPGLGTLMIQRMESGDGPHDLGQRIKAMSEEIPAATLDAAEREWLDAHPDDVDRIADILSQARRELCTLRASASCELMNAPHLAADTLVR